MNDLVEHAYCGIWPIDPNRVAPRWSLRLTSALQSDVIIVFVYLKYKQLGWIWNRNLSLFTLVVKLTLSKFVFKYPNDWVVIFKHFNKFLFQISTVKFSASEIMLTEFVHIFSLNTTKCLTSDNIDISIITIQIDFLIILDDLRDFDNIPCIIFFFLIISWRIYRRNGCWLNHSCAPITQ